jgi:hypothetical protein
MRHPVSAATAAVNFRIIRRPWKKAGYLFGIAEVCIGILLLSPWLPWTVAASVLATVLSLGFAFMIGRALAAGEKFPCHCLPGSDGELSALALWRAIAMILASIASAVGLVVSRTVVPPPRSIIAGVGLTALILGMPLAVTSTSAVWRHYRHFMAETDWEWVIQSRALGGHPPTLRTHASGPAGESVHDDEPQPRQREGVQVA